MNGLFLLSISVIMFINKSEFDDNDNSNSISFSNIDFECCLYEKI